MIIVRPDRERLERSEVASLWIAAWITNRRDSSVEAVVDGAGSDVLVNERPGRFTSFNRLPTEQVMISD